METARNKTAIKISGIFILPDLKHNMANRCSYKLKGFIHAGKLKRKWRREQDSNLQALTGGSFQDYCISQLCYLSTKLYVHLCPKYPGHNEVHCKLYKEHYNLSNPLYL